MSVLPGAAMGLAESDRGNPSARTQPARRAVLPLSAHGLRGVKGAAALLLVLLFASQVYLWVNWWPIRIGIMTAGIWALPQVTVWLMLCPLVIHASRRWPLEGARRIGHAGLHLVGSAAFSALSLALIDGSDRALHWTRLLGAPDLISRLKYTVIHFHWGTAIYWVLLAADHTGRYFAALRAREVREARLEGQLAEARLAALRLQLEPHFLFNTLNAIAVLLRRDVDGAEHMVHRLAEFLRGTLGSAEAGLVPLDEELKRIVSYLAIEARRFGDRLSVEYSIASEARPALVPAFILQPLVENALRHGIGPRPEPGRLIVHARVDAGRLHLIVEDDGVGLAEAPREGTGLGVTRRRLETQFGTGQSFQVRSRAGGGTEVRLAIPLLSPTLGQP